MQISLYVCVNIKTIPWKVQKNTFFLKKEVLADFQICISVPLIKNPEMLRFLPVCLKTKEMCENAVKKLPFVIRYVSD